MSYFYIVLHRFFHFILCECFVCPCTTFIKWPQSLEGRVRNPGSGVAGSSEPLCGSWNLNLGSVQEQWALFLAEPSLLPLSMYFGYKIFVQYISQILLPVCSLHFIILTALFKILLKVGISIFICSSTLPLFWETLAYSKVIIISSKYSYRNFKVKGLPFRPLIITKRVFILRMKNIEMYLLFPQRSGDSRTLW